MENTHTHTNTHIIVMGVYTDPEKISESDFHLSSLWREKGDKLFSRDSCQEPTNWMGKKMERGWKDRVLNCS